MGYSLQDFGFFRLQYLQEFIVIYGIHVCFTGLKKVSDSYRIYGIVNDILIKCFDVSHFQDLNKMNCIDKLFFAIKLL